MAVDTSSRQAEKLTAIEQQFEFIERCKLRHELMKRKSKWVKRSIETAEIRMGGLIRSDPDQEVLPGFDRYEIDREFVNWDEVTVMVLLGDKDLVGKLGEFNIHTIGQLLAFVDSDLDGDDLHLDDCEYRQIEKAVMLYRESEQGE